MNYSDFSWYRGNLEWLPSRTIFLTKHGSQAYGTALPSSDTDLKGIAIAPREYYLGFLKSFEQAEVREPVDAVVYDIRKFFKLAADCNPNIIEMLFTDESDWILPRMYPGKALGYPFRSSAWGKIHDQRHLFLSRKARHTFSGYAVAQLKRIRTHRQYLLNPPKAEPTREEFGLKSGQRTLDKESLALANARIRKLQDRLGGAGMTKDTVEDIDPIVIEQAIVDVNLPRYLIPVILAERRYGNACKAWSQYQTHLAERNPARAELEAKFGYDTKHAMHLVRLLRMAGEILRGEGVIVKRPDAEELLRIRAGAWSFESLEEWAKDKELEVAVASSPLPNEPDRAILDRLLVEVIEAAL